MVSSVVVYPGQNVWKLECEEEIVDSMTKIITNNMHHVAFQSKCEYFCHKTVFIHQKGAKTWKMGGNGDHT